MQTDVHALRQYRLDNGLTLRAFAEQVEATDATISRIETWIDYPSARLLAKLVHVTGIQAEHFLPPLPKNWKKRCG